MRSTRETLPLEVGSGGISLPDREFDGEPTQPTGMAVPATELEGPRRTRATLLVVEGSEVGRLFALPVDEPATLGRGSEADLCVDDPTVSRRHATIAPRQGRYYVVDLGSVNGTFVGSDRVHGNRELRPGDRLRLGQRVTLRFDLHDRREQETLVGLYEGAVRDPLTELYNRGYLEDRLGSEVSYALRHEASLAVLMIDVDRFKRVNDTHGHAAGDAVLRVLSTMLRRLVRPEDVVARYGGEEMVVVARGLDARNGWILAERLRRAVAQMRLQWKGRPVELTVSVGVSALDNGAGPDNAAALLAAADDALYQAKRAGRNRSVQAGQDPGRATVGRAPRPTPTPAG